MAGQKVTTDRILEFANRFVEGMPEGIASTDHDDLYSENGLPT
jgi:hypothetical protein